MLKEILYLFECIKTKNKREYFPKAVIKIIDITGTEYYNAYIAKKDSVPEEMMTSEYIRIYYLNEVIIIPSSNLTSSFVYEMLENKQIFIKRWYTKSNNKKFGVITKYYLL